MDHSPLGGFEPFASWLRQESRRLNQRGFLNAVYLISSGKKLIWQLVTLPICSVMPNALGQLRWKIDQNPL